MCLDCGAWTTGISRLLAQPCEPEEITEARARGLKRFLKGLHPCKATSIAQEQEAKLEAVKAVIEQLNTPQHGTKRVLRAQQYAAKVAAKVKQPRVQEPDDSTPGASPSCAPSQPRPQPPPSPHQDVLVRPGCPFDDPEADMDMSEVERDYCFSEEPPIFIPEPRQASRSSSSQGNAHCNQGAATAPKRPQRMSKAKREELQAQGLARVVKNLKNRLKQFKEAPQ